MTGCQVCGGYGMHHDPIAHGNDSLHRRSGAARALDGTEPERECRRQPDAYIKPRYPVDEPPTYRAQCGCGWAGPERYRGITDSDWHEHIEGADE